MYSYSYSKQSKAIKREFHLCVENATIDLTILHVHVQHIHSSFSCVCVHDVFLYMCPKFKK